MRTIGTSLAIMCVLSSGAVLAHGGKVSSKDLCHNHKATKTVHFHKPDSNEIRGLCTRRGKVTIHHSERIEVRKVPGPVELKLVTECPAKPVPVESAGCVKLREKFERDLLRAASYQIDSVTRNYEKRRKAIGCKRRD